MYGTKEAFLDWLRLSCFCLNKKKKAAIKHEIFKMGREKLRKKLDIASIIKKMRVQELVSNVYLNKFQTNLVPYFQNNMLTHQLYQKELRKKQEMKKLEATSANSEEHNH